MSCDIRKIDSNVAGCHMAEEECIGDLPVAPNVTKWYKIEYNDLPNFGSDYKKEARDPIGASRQNQKAVVVDEDAGISFKCDILKSDIKRYGQGFFFANAREKASTEPLNGQKTNLTATTTTEYTAASGLDVFSAGDIVYVTGFDNPENNGRHVVTSSTSTTLTVAETLIVETPDTSASISVCGKVMPDDDISMSVGTSQFYLTSVSQDFTSLGLNVGEWIFVGGDAVNSKFSLSGAGYARIYKIEANTLTFDGSTFSPLTESGLGFTIELYFASYIRNEQPSLIKRKTYQAEVTLGKDEDGTQSVYVVGSAPNEMKVNINQGTKMTVDYSFVSQKTEYRSGLEGLKAGERYSEDLTSTFNATSHVYRNKISIKNDSVMNSSPLFAYVTDGSITFNNGVKPEKAIGVKGAFDMSSGNFTVSASLTGVFRSVSQIQAVGENSEIEYNVILANENSGVIYDIPFATFSGGKPSLPKDESIKLPLEIMASENKNGYTASITAFDYLPDAAMPV